MAITEALAKFRHYLLGHPFISRTDQQSLKCLLDQSLQTPEQQAWLHKFIGYDFNIEYRPGKENLTADALSRMLFAAWSEPQHKFLVELQQELTKDAYLAATVQQCLANSHPDPHYTVREGLLYWKGRLVLPTGSPLIPKILLEYHASPIGGYSGVARTLARIVPQFY